MTRCLAAMFRWGAHPGIDATAKKAMEELKRNVFMILGGTHLLRHSDRELQKVIGHLKELGIQKIGATHCSGDKPMAKLKEAFADGFIQMGVGRVIVVKESTP